MILGHVTLHGYRAPRCFVTRTCCSTNQLGCGRTAPTRWIIPRVVAVCVLALAPAALWGQANAGLPATGTTDKASADKASADKASADTSRLGTISGTVVYKQDPSRPWRYARYYVKWPMRGHLAEAVVALQGKGLNGLNPPAAPSTAEMDQRDFRFIPETIAIRAGDSVHFTNSDVQVHNVRTYDGLRPFNVNTPMGGEYTHQFERPGGIRGPIRIGCSYHGQMRAWIYVFPHSFFAVTGEDGKFLWMGVPPGEYEIHTAHPAGGLRTSQAITVQAGEITQVEVQVTPDHLSEEKP